MNEQERESFIKKIGISADDSNESDNDEEENDPELHKYNCKKCQVSLVRTGVKIHRQSSTDFSKHLTALNDIIL